MMKSKGKGKMKDRTRMVRVNNPQYMDNTDAGSYTLTLRGCCKTLD